MHRVGVGEQQIVATGKASKLSASMALAQPARWQRRTAQQSYPPMWIVHLGLGDDLRRLILRFIVQHQDLKVWVCLCLQRRQACADGALLIARWHQDGDARPHVIWPGSGGE